MWRRAFGCWVGVDALHSCRGGATSSTPREKTLSHCLQVKKCLLTTLAALLGIAGGAVLDRRHTLCWGSPSGLLIFAEVMSLQASARLSQALGARGHWGWQRAVPASLHLDLQKKEPYRNVLCDILSVQKHPTLLVFFIVRNFRGS